MPRFACSRAFAILALFAVTTAASGAEQPTKCSYRMAGQLPLQYHGSGMEVTLTGQINYTPAVMLLDTGASDTFLTQLGTDKRAMRLTPTLAAVTGVGGMTRLYRAPVRHFQIGPVKSEEDNGSMMAIDEMGDRPQYDAIVGSDFLMGMDLEISLSEKLVKFFSAENCKKTFLGYWDRNTVVVPMLFELDYTRPRMEVALNGVKMIALIDTGAASSSVTRSAAARAGVTPASAGVTKAGTFVGIGSKRVSFYNAAFRTFSVGLETIKNPVIKLMEGEHKGFDMVLGTDFLRAHRVLLAVSQKNVYLSYIGGPPFDNGKANTWIEQEAKTGNSYGQFRMAMGALRSGGKQAESAGREWLNKSVAGNNPLALHYLAREHGRLGRDAESVAAYERLTAIDSHDLTTQLELFAMRTRTGQAAEAKAGLTAAVARFKWPRWPAPIAAYYLGASTLDDVLRQARKDSDLAPRRECEVYWHARAFQDALGEASLAKTLALNVKDSCAAQFDWSGEL